MSLNCFMVDELPNAGRFEDTMNPIIDRAAGSRKRRVRAYGEMVDVLWRNDQRAGAVSLEILWNQLIARRKCSLLCGYSLDAVGKGGGTTESVISTAMSTWRIGYEQRPHGIAAGRSKRAKSRPGSSQTLPRS